MTPLALSRESERNNDLDDTSSLLQSRRSGHQTITIASARPGLGAEVRMPADPAGDVAACS